MSCALFVLVAMAPRLGSQTPEPRGGDWIKVYVEDAGAYRIDVDQLLELSSPEPGFGTRELQITHRGRRLPQWLDEGRRRLVFVVSRSLFEAQSHHEESRLVALRLDFDGEAPIPRWDTGPERTVSPRDLTRIVRFEEDQLLAPLTAAPTWSSPTLWYWTLLSQRSSSELRITTALPETVLRDANLGLRLRMLGWSRPQRDEVAHHAVTVSLEGSSVGSGRWDGRRPFELRLENLGVPEGTPDDGEVTLQVKVPRRTDDTGREIVDLSYLDWIELDHPLDPGPLAQQQQVRLDVTPTQAAQWIGMRPPRLGGSEGAKFLVATAEPDAQGQLEAYVATAEQLLQPLKVAAVSAATLDEDAQPTAQHLIVAPPPFLEHAHRLAALREARGLETLVVDAHQIFNELGDGLRRTQPLRDYLLDRHRRHTLRTVLLVGDADWYSPDDPPLEEVTGHRNLLPSWTYLSRYGPAVSDHYYTVGSETEATPRFALGRLPVATEEELTKVVDKIERFSSIPPGPEKSALLLGSLDSPSQGRLRRLRRRWQPGDYAPLELERTAGTPFDETLLELWNEEPTVIYFSGHGSRHLWRLGDVDDQSPGTLWTQEEAGRAAPTERPPAVLSISCSTAPFDHPNNDSMGEALVLDPDGGAIAFFGASATLFTQPRFGERLLTEVTNGTPLGEALVEAKSDAANAALSHLYSLLGDPTLAVP